MKFRITRSFYGYRAQVFKYYYTNDLSQVHGKWEYINNNCYATPVEAREACVNYKDEKELNVLEEFVL